MAFLYQHSAKKIGFAEPMLPQRRQKAAASEATVRLLKMGEKMNTRKLIVKISYGLIATLMVVLIGLLVYQQRHIRQISQNDKTVPSVAVIPDSKNLAEPHPLPGDESGREQLEAEVDALRYQLEASEEELDMAREDLANGQRGLYIQNIIAMNKKTRENPILMKRWREDIENNLDQTHGALFEKLGLPDEKLQAFKTLQADYEIENHDLVFLIMDPSQTEEERIEDIQKLEDQKSELSKKTRELLSDENYKIYEAYQERITERNFVYGMDNTLIADLGLSDEKAQELIDAMYEARKEMEAEYDNDSIGNISPSPSEQFERMLKTYDVYNESAQSVLSESQVKEFEARINEHKEMMKMDPFLGDGNDESQ